MHKMSAFSSSPRALSKRCPFKVHRKVRLCLTSKSLEVKNKKQKRSRNLKMNNSKSKIVTG